MKNGVLLAAAEEAGFDLFITADQELDHQQNLTGRRVAILVLSTNNWGVIKQRIGKINEAIDCAGSGSFTFLEIGHGRR